MPVTLNPQLKYGVSFKENLAQKNMQEQTVAAPPAQTSTATSAQPKPSLIKRMIAKIAYGWINLSEFARGLTAGVIVGGITGTGLAAADLLVSGVKNIKDLGFKQAFKPSNSLGKVGKILAPITSLVVLVGFMINAKLNANKRTANVDHAIYTGHRDK